MAAQEAAPAETEFGSETSLNCQMRQLDWLLTILSFFTAAAEILTVQVLTVVAPY